jgi:hypothetical protein
MKSLKQPSTIRSGWKAKEGDQLEQSNGNLLTIEKIDIVKLKEKITVYNFEVADFHTYFVSDLGIWVHNIGSCNREIKLPSVKTYEQARNKAMSILGNFGEGSARWIGGMEASYGYGKVVGRISSNGKKRWRVDWDKEKGMHINLEDFTNGKGDKAYKAYIPFEGNEKTFKSLINMLNR